MHSPELNQEATSFSPAASCPEHLPAIAPVSQDAEAADPRVVQTAQNLADVINDFEHQLSKRDGVSAVATGRLEFGFQSQTFELVVVPGAEGDARPITVQAKLKTHHSPASIPTIAPSAFKPTRRDADADAELERDFVPRKQRKLAEFHDAPTNELVSRKTGSLRLRSRRRTSTVS